MSTTTGIAEYYRFTKPDGGGAVVSANRMTGLTITGKGQVAVTFPGVPEPIALAGPDAVDACERFIRIVRGLETVNITPLFPPA